MFLIEKLSNNIANKISYPLNLDKDQEEVIAYGVFNLIQTLWCILLVILFGTIFGVTIKAIVISITIGFLRKYSGGAHSSSPNRCALIGTLVSVGLALVIQNAIYGISINVTIIIGIIVFIFAYYSVWKLAPVDSEAKPITKPEKRRLMRRNSIYVLIILNLIIIMLTMFYFKFKINLYLSTIFCIYFGILWQIITLIPKGHKVLLKIDTFLNNISYTWGGEKNEK
ncbi:accessory gene regulator ArgB-like protein [Clostridium sp. DJ247]|uniref:accessory gene regulator ArgB-like protein n=1 Tax=Clostridium sp. DJ247 TaxID=2726188 RepID=UPI001624C878|nr:accessory gene regulator B family protein [Clostridium sp. DJ247]MBC2579788.1 accessory gene regulator B family protein [Clostridium sp. DJ247]